MEINRETLKEILQEIMAEEVGTGFVPMLDRWIGGKIYIEPRNGQNAKEIPIDTFFHKIVMIRDRVRVMEQKINASKKLEDAEKVELQQYITKIYGTLTTFNILFAEKEDFFTGDSTKKG